MRRTFLIAALFAAQLGVAQIAAACATSIGEITGNLSNAAALGTIPAPFTFTELDAQAHHRLDVTVFDSLKAAHPIRIYFIRVGSTDWLVYSVIDGGEVVGGTAGEAMLMSSGNLSFDADGNELPAPYQVGGIVSWANGARQSTFIIPLRGMTLSAAATSVTASVDGSATTCAQANAKDFDGDGVDDVVLWLEGRLTWSIRLSSKAQAEILNRKWGKKGDIPLTGDFTGDRRADLVYWRPSNHRWYVCSSDSGFDCANATERTLSGSKKGDLPLASDLDGDGTTDLALYRPRAGLVLFEGSRTGLTTIPFGSRSYKPVPNPAPVGN